MRRIEVATLRCQGYDRGSIAARLGVSPSTIGRDVGRCPTCQRRYGMPSDYDG